MENKLERIKIVKILRVFVNVLWIGVAIISLIVSVKEIYHLFLILFSNKNEVGIILHEIVTIFIFIEIVAMILKYFEENYHFPLRYILYITITALARHIIGDFDNSYLYTIAILLLAISYAILRFVSYITKYKEELPKDKSL